MFISRVKKLKGLRLLHKPSASDGGLTNLTDLRHSLEMRVWERLIRLCRQIALKVLTQGWPHQVSVEVAMETVTAKAMDAVLVAVGLAFLALGATGFGNILVLAGILTPLNTYLLYPATRTFQNRFLPRLESAYERFLTYVLGGRRPWAFFFGTVGFGPRVVVFRQACGWHCGRHESGQRRFDVGD